MADNARHQGILLFGIIYGLFKFVRWARMHSTFRTALLGTTRIGGYTTKVRLNDSSCAGFAQCLVTEDHNHEKET